MNKLGKPEWATRPSEEVVNPRKQHTGRPKREGALRRSLLALAGSSRNDTPLNVRTLNFEKLVIL